MIWQVFFSITMKEADERFAGFFYGASYLVISDGGLDLAWLDVVVEVFSTSFAERVGHAGLD